MQAKSFALNELFVSVRKDELYGRTCQRQTLTSAVSVGRGLICGPAYASVSELLCLLGLRGRHGVRRRRRQPSTHLGDRASHCEGGVKDLADRNATLQTMATDCLESCRCDASAVCAIRLAAELARGDLVLEIGRETLGRLREDALLRCLGRLGVDLQHAVEHLQLGVSRSHARQVSDHLLAVSLGQALG